jgi:hypothetical protein
LRVQISLDGNGVKGMPGLIPAPNSGVQIGHINKKVIRKKTALSDNVELKLYTEKG